MASEDQSRKKEGSPGPATAPFEWGAILSAVKDQIPSMDSDISMSDCDEDGELFIFQREQSNLIPDLSEELEDLSLEEVDLQKTFTFMRHPRETWSDDPESAAFPNAESIPQSDSGGHGLVDRGGFDLRPEVLSSQQATAVSTFPANEYKPGEGISGCLGEKKLDISKDKETPNSLPDIFSSVEAPPFLNTTEEEQRQLTKTKILSKVTLEPPSGDASHPQTENNRNNFERIAKARREPGAISAEHPRELSLFAFQDIEKWDLDKILQDLEKQSDDRTWTEENNFPSMDHASPSVLPSETLRAVSQTRLMGKLEELCLKQSRAFFSHRRRRLAKLPHFNECQGDGRDVPIPAPLTNGQCLTPAEWQCAPEPPTVYIDLRDTAPQTPEPLADEQQSSSDSSTDDTEEDMDVTGQGNVTEPMKEFFQPSRKNCTGKSFLLQQLRNFRGRMFQPLAAASDKEKSQSLKNSEETKVLKVRRRRCLKLRGLASMGPASSESHTGSFPLLDPVSSTAGLSRGLKEETEKGLCSESAAEPPRVQESQKGKQAKETLRRQRFQEHLERLRPQHSITGKQPMAEQTPILFHTEASFFAPIKTLPTPKGTESEMLLLTVCLSSCGQVASCSRPNRSFLETSLPAVNIYSAVVTWLLSLVSAREESQAPFQVLGLQQAWHKDGLALHACLKPANESVVQSSSKLRNRKIKKFLRGTSPFYQQTFMFLTHTHLSDVIWWKAELANHLQNQPYPFVLEIPPVLLSCITVVNADPAAVEKAFAVPAGFYWQTVETDEKYFPSSSDIRESSDMDTEVAMTLLFETLFRNPTAVHHMLQLILASGLDICGLRLLYPQYSMLLSSTVPLPSCYTQEKVAPVVALSLRGPQARSVLQDIMGPSDPQLARVTNRSSINAIYCTSRVEPLAYLPHLDSRVHRELSVWFGGRVCCDEMLHGGDTNLACQCNKLRPSSLQEEVSQEKSTLRDAASLRLPATLVSTTKGDVILVASPAVPPNAYGAVIPACTRRGFALQGIKQLQLPPKQALVLRVPASQVAIFCRGTTSCPPDRGFSGDDLPVQPHVRCLALLLRKENASHHIPALLKGLMSGLAEKSFLREVQTGLGASVEPELDLCFHAVPYTESLLQALGGSFNAVPDSSHVPLDMLRNRRYASDPEMEQVVLLTLAGKEAMKSAGSFLHQLLVLGYRKQVEMPVSEEFRPRFELLAVKWLPYLTRFQAKEITPFEVGDKSWQASIKVLMSGPALVCALRRIGAFVGLAEALKTVMPCSGKLGANSHDLQRVMSLTPEMAFRQAVLFFTEKDFVGDPRNRPALRFLPPPRRPSQSKGKTRTWINFFAQYTDFRSSLLQDGGMGSGLVREIQRSHAESIFRYMQAGAQVLCTVLLIKPDTWACNLARILRKLDLEKFHLVGMKHINLKPEDVKMLLSSEAKQDSAVLEAHTSYLASGFSLVLCLQRENAVKKLLDLLGPEDPKQARKMNPSFWRAQYGVSASQNGFYGSTSYCAAVRDIKLFFPEGLCGAECPALEENEICTVTSDPVACLKIDKPLRLVKRKTRQQLHFLGSEQPQTPEQPHLAVLCQTTPLIFPETILQGAGRPPYLELLEKLIAKGFLVTGARLTVMSKSQACFISETLSTTETEASVMSSRLTGGSCLVLAVQRDNAVVCFDSLLTSDYCQKQAVLDCVQHLLYPKTEKQAEELLCRLFDSLTASSIYQIESQGS